MNCTEIHDRLLASFEAPDSAIDADIAGHLEACELCRHRYSDHALVSLLRSHQAVPMRNGLVDDVIRSAVTANSRPQAALQRFGALAASVAVVALTLAVFAWTPQGDDGALQSGNGHVALISQQQTVQVMIDSPTERRLATITIELADNLEMEGFPENRVIEWQTELAAGKNLLALPLQLRDGRESHFKISLAHGDRREEIRVAVQPRRTDAGWMNTTPIRT